jgi:hypothetical protein
VLLTSSRDNIPAELVTLTGSRDNIPAELVLLTASRDNIPAANITADWRGTGVELSRSRRAGYEGAATLNELQVYLKREEKNNQWAESHSVLCTRHTIQVCIRALRSHAWPVLAASHCTAGHDPTWALHHCHQANSPNRLAHSRSALTTFWVRIWAVTPGYHN